MTGAASRPAAAPVDRLVAAAVEHGPAGVAVLDGEGRYVYLNACLAQAHGVTAHDALGRRVREVAPHLAAQVEALVAQVLDDGRAVTGLELAGSGATRWSTSWQPLTDDASRPGLVALLAIDVTELAAVREELQHSRAQTLVLQRALAPPAVSSDELAAAVRRPPPRTAASGCWCDVLDLGAGRLAVAVGEVTGQAPTAALAAQLGTAVRSCARRGMRPVEVLDLLDAVVADLPGAAATCLYGVYEPHTRRLELASAGQRPPVLRSPAGGAEVLSLEVTGPLGSGDAARSASVVVPPGGVVALHTAGLTAGAPDPYAGVLALAAALVRGPESLEALADSVVDTLVEQPGADHVLLLLQVPADVAARSRAVTLPVARDRGRAGEVRELVRHAGQQWTLLPEVTDLAVLIASELVTNSLVHGLGHIEVRLRLTRDRLVVEVSDQSHLLPRRSGLRAQDERGRGLHLVSMLSHRWGARSTDEGKVVWSELDLAAV